MDYELIQGSTGTPFGNNLTEGPAPPDVPLTNATVTFRMAQIDGSKLIEGAADIVDATNWVVSYQWQPGDLDVPGLYKAQWEVDFGSGPDEYPSNGYQIIYVRPKVGL